MAEIKCPHCEENLFREEDLEKISSKGITNADLVRLMAFLNRRRWIKKEIEINNKRLEALLKIFEAAEWNVVKRIVEKKQ